MVIFSLVNSTHTGGYYVASDQASMGWCELPRDLARQIEDIRLNGEEVKEVSIGLDGDWFLRTNIRRVWKTEYGRADTCSNVEICNQLTKRIAMGPYIIQHFTFVPDCTGYVAILYNDDGSFTHCSWHNAPPKLAALLSREASKGVHRVAVGVNGSYVVVLNNGCIWWSGVPESLSQLLNNARRTGRAVVTVSLSLVSPNWYFVEFADGITEYVLPRGWHASINKHTSRAKSSTGSNILTSSNSRTSPSTHFPPQAEYGSFSPARIAAHSSHPEYTPFDPNSYPAPILTPAPSTVSNVTYAYPALPQRPQTRIALRLTQENFSDMYQMLSGLSTVLSPGPGLDLGTGFGSF